MYQYHGFQLETYQQFSVALLACVFTTSEFHVVPIIEFTLEVNYCLSKKYNKNASNASAEGLHNIIKIARFF
jgi:hypothetical protein